MFRTALAIGLSVTVAASALAADVKESVELKDGTAVIVLADAKMAMEDRFGNPVSMAEGRPMQTVDGRTLVMKGNELWVPVWQDIKMARR